MVHAIHLWLYLVAAYLIGLSEQHGRMIEPASRSSMWRYGFNTPTNYNDNELYCGGRSEIQKLGGLCGVCGDPYHGRRENEAGGRYATGQIAREYPNGTPTITVRIELTAWHMGHYEFRICPHNNPSKPVTQECLNKYKLPIAESSDDEPTHYKPERGGIHEITLLLPPGMTCSQCVLQWRYRAGNSWGTDPEGRSCLGCGVQEEFRNCADIKIGDHSSAPSTHEPFVEEIEPVFNQIPSHNRDVIHPFAPDFPNGKSKSMDQQVIPEMPNHLSDIAEISTQHWKDPENAFNRRLNTHIFPTQPPNELKDDTGLPIANDAENIIEPQKLPEANNAHNRRLNTPIFPTQPSNELKDSTGLPNDAENIIKPQTVLEANFPRTKTTEVPAVKIHTFTTPDNRRGDDRAKFQRLSEDRDWFRHRVRDPLINLPSRREHNAQRSIPKIPHLGQIKPSGQILHRDSAAQEHDRRNMVWRDRNINNHFSEISRPRDLNEMLRRRNKGLLDPKGRNRLSDRSGNSNRRLIINRTFVPTTRQRQDTEHNLRQTTEQVISPVRRGLFRSDARIERPRQSAVENDSKKNVHEAIESSRAKLRKSFDRNKRIRDLWRNIVLLSRFKMLRKSLSKKNTGNNFRSRMKSFPVALPFQTKTRTVSLSNTPPDEGDITSKIGNTLPTSQRNSNPSTNSKSNTNNASNKVVKTYKNKYNKTSSSSLEGSKSSSAWYENLLYHAKKQKATVISNNKVKLSDSTVIRIPKGAVLGG